jgi:rhodanese-related sulfurtransferase
MNIQTIMPHELAELCKNGNHIELIDVRTPVEYRHLHAADARNIPLDKLDPIALMQAHNGSEQPIYLICHSGARSTQACEKFFNVGYTNVVSVEGGTKAWESNGLPVILGKKAISLERQVRIAAGMLICTGVLLGWLVHPAFYALPAFVGAGLIHAGVTDTCAMGLLLARMPWNRANLSTCGCS